jgi:hypothetical protein
LMSGLGGFGVVGWRIVFWVGGFMGKS